MCYDSKIGPTILTTTWLNTEIYNIADDVLQNENLPRVKINTVNNFRFQRGKRISNNSLIQQGISSFPSELIFDKLKQAVQTDEFAGSMVKFLELNELPEDNKKARILVLQYFVQNELLYHIWYTPPSRCTPERNVYQLYIPMSCMDAVLNNCHDNVLAAHSGFHRTYGRIRQRYF